ncbi:MAG: FAD-dependent oxidoreductase, partial [Oceanococcaceae bacterium]
MKERSRTARPRLGIIGSGIAGLTAAWLLKERFEVTLFEAHERPGMGAFTAELPLAEGHHLVDVPTRVFCAGYYPQLYQLLAHIGVELEATDHAAAYADEQGKTYFHYANLRLLGRSISRLSLRSARSPKALKMAWAAQGFFAQVRADQRRLPALQNISFERYLQQSQSSADFVDGLLMPALCVILTCSPEEARAYPADLLLAYLGSGVMQQGVMRASLGVGDVVDRLIGGVKLRCGSRVAEVRPGKTSSTVLLEDGHREEFAQVVMAAQAQHSAQMLPPEHGASALLQTVPWARSQM